MHASTTAMRRANDRGRKERKERNEGKGTGFIAANSIAAKPFERVRGQRIRYSSRRKSPMQRLRKPASAGEVLVAA